MDFERSTDAAVAALMGRIDQVRLPLRQRSADAKERLANLDKRKQELAKSNGGTNVRGSDRIRLNVGGKSVVASRDTLTQMRGTRLEALFSGRWEDRLLRDAKKRIFLDVDPLSFRKIVDYLNLFKIAPPDDPPEPPEVADEERATFEHTLEFFGLREAMVPPPKLDTKIVTEVSHLKKLHEWLSEANDSQDVELKLLYRASRDGWGAADFHAKCDGRAMTLTVVRSADGYVFGGFADAPWAQQGNWVSTCQNAFLFALHCAAGLPPTKMPLNAGEPHHIRCGSRYGPVFGAGNDLCIADNASSNIASHTNVGRTYQLPVGHVGSTFLTGALNFQASQVEVFEVVVPDGISTPAAVRSTGALEHASLDLADVPADVAKPLQDEADHVAAFEEDVIDLEKKFEQERAFIDFFSGEQKDIVDLNVSGEAMTVKRSTLMQCAESVLARQFDDRVWSQQHEDEHYDSDDEGVLIEQSPYCFGKIVNQLRLRAMQSQPPPPPAVPAHERKNFERTVAYYFPGVEDFILSSGIN